MIKPKSYWLVISNTDFAQKLNNTDKLNYPLALNMPITSLTNAKETTELGKYAKKITVTCGLAFSLNRSAKNISEKEAKKIIKGYHVCVSTSDSFLVDRLLSPSTRDTGNCYYMSWWFDGASKISRIVENITFEKLKNNKISLQTEGQNLKVALVSDYTHSPEKIISFLSEHITLQKGDLISLGQTRANFSLSNDNTKYKIIAAIENIGQFEFLLKTK